MKSVVVESSTVAKAIELAWIKAERPEEFFIRVLQEHTFGFFGFGGKKAKVVLFFKNNHKTDSQFPTVLKQKEYASFFDNNNLKNPSSLDVVDVQLNKHVAIGHGPKKKHGQVAKSGQLVQHQAPQQNQSHQQKNKPVVQGQQSSQVTKSVQVQSQQQLPAQSVKQVVAQKNSAQQQGQPKNQQKQIKPQSQTHEKTERKDQEKPAQHEAQKQQAAQQGAGHNSHKSQHGQQEKVAQVTHAKDDVVGNIAKVFAKVASERIVASVSRPVDKDGLSACSSASQNAGQSLSSFDKVDGQKNYGDKIKTMTPKFESYAEFMDAQADKAAAKAQSVLQAIEKIEKVIEKPAAQDAVLAKIESMAAQAVVSTPVVPAQPEVIVAEKPVVAKPGFVKMKRRPLSTENSGVSGITRMAAPQPVEEKIEQREQSLPTLSGDKE